MWSCAAWGGGGGVRLNILAAAEDICVEEEEKGAALMRGDACADKGERDEGCWLLDMGEPLTLSLADPDPREIFLEVLGLYELPLSVENTEVLR